MNKKKTADIIKKSIYLKFEDITDKLTVDNSLNKKYRKPIFKYCTSLCVIVTAAVILLIYGIYNNRDVDNTLDLLQINQIEYRNFDDLIKYEKVYYSPKLLTFKELHHLFEYNINLEESKISNISCNLDINTNELIQCNISYSVGYGLILISIKQKNLPTFETETVDTWEQNTFSKNLKVSSIGNYEIIILKNTNNSSYIKEYYNKDVINYKTKFMIHDIGITIDSYNVDEIEFLQILKRILSENS